MKDKYLSIITNFGCHYTCPYCVVKNNNLHIPKTTIGGLAKLNDAIKEHGVNWVSISGGGDPLYHVIDNFDWYMELLDCLYLLFLNGTDVQLEMHTSYLYMDFIWEQLEICAYFDRVVYHARSIEDLDKIRRCYKNQIVRVVFVVTEDFTPEKIDSIVRAVKRSPYIDELSFRQMIDSNYEVTHYCEDYLCAGHQKDWWYIEQNDYNIYYCENQVSYRYEDFKDSRE